MNRSREKIFLRALALLMTACFALGFAACESKPASTTPAGDDVVDLTSNLRISISEVMADNDSFYLNCTDDWAELYNDGDADLLLTGYRLYDEIGGTALPLDGYTVPSKGYAVVRIGDNAPFHLSKKGGELLLFNKAELVDRLSYPEAIGSLSWTHDGQCAEPSPGFANTHSGHLAYLDSVPVPEIRINEVVSSNSKYAPVDGEYFDFVEIFNGSSEDVELSEFCLSDKKSELDKFRLPGGVLRAGGYYLVYCSGGAKEGHAPFKISSSGEKLYLSRGGVVVDCVSVPGDIKQDESYGRNGSAFVYICSVTPGAENAVGVSSMPQAPTASIPSGVSISAR